MLFFGDDPRVNVVQSDMRTLIGSETLKPCINCQATAESSEYGHNHSPDSPSFSDHQKVYESAYIHCIREAAPGDSTIEVGITNMRSHAGGIGGPCATFSLLFLF